MDAGLKADYAILQPMTRELARDAVQRLAAEADVCVAAHQGIADLYTVRHNAESRDEHLFAARAGNSLFGLHDTAVKATAGGPQEEVERQTRWADAVCVAGARAALQTIASGMAPGSAPAAQVAMVAAMAEGAHVERQRDPRGVPMLDTFKTCLREVGFEGLSPEAERAIALLSDHYPPESVVVAVGKELFPNLVDDTPMTPLPRLVASTALAELARETDRRAYLDESAKYLGVLMDVLPDGPEKDEARAARGETMMGISRIEAGVPHPLQAVRDQIKVYERHAG